MRLKIFFFLLSSVMLFSTYGQNLIENGNFEQDYDNWNRLTGTNGAMTFYSLETDEVHSGAQSMRVSVRSVGKNPWDNQLYHKSFYPKTGEDYRLSFFAKTKEGEVKIKAVAQNTTYSETTLTITPEWNEYTWEFTAKEDFLQLKFFFIETGLIYLDDITIIGKNFKPVEIPTTDTTVVDIAVKHQKIEGFGSALAFFESWIYDHPNKEELYKLAFQDLGLDWLRIRNDYKFTNEYAKYSKEFVDKAKQWRGDSIRILMCGWSPPADFKNNNNTNNGTLKKENGEFIYERYAEYWKEALLAYHKAGIKPDWLSMQNEPDWLTDKWETCKFTPSETEQYPGYDKAFNLVVAKFKDIPDKPKMLGAEMLGIGNNQFYSYNSKLKDNENLYAYAYHMYNGGDPDNPDSYNPAFRNIKKDFNNKPNIMTEFEHSKGEWYKTAWLMNNTLTEADLTAYFFWDLIWPATGLIGIENPNLRNTWKTPKGYVLNDHYYAFKHFSKYIDAGYYRIDHKCSNEFLRSSAYISPDGKTVVVVITNPTEKEISSSIELKGQTVLSSKVIQSVTGDFWKELGQLQDGKVVVPSYSVTTIVLTL